MVQRHLRRSPDAFLARKVLVGEGRTEHGLMRGLDNCWTNDGKDSMALRGATSINGGGNPAAGQIAEHLLDLGYDVLLLIDTDQPLPTDLVERIKKKAGKVCEWPDSCSTEERMFLDLPWEIVIDLVRFAEEFVGPDSMKARINAECHVTGLNQITDLTFPSSLSTPAFRRALGKASKNEKRPWFKDIDRGERLAELISPCLDKISSTPLALTISDIRKWIDG
jgi:hypothetical protein